MSDDDSSTAEAYGYDPETDSIEDATDGEEPIVGGVRYVGPTRWERFKRRFGPVIAGPIVIGGTILVAGIVTDSVGGGVVVFSAIAFILVAAVAWALFW